MPTEFTVEDVESRDIAVLRIRGELGLEARREFAQHVQELLLSPRSKLVVDLTGVSRIFSIYFGSLVDLSQQAEGQERSLSVLVSKEQARRFEQASLQVTLNLVTVGAQ
ncbi:MAG: STAS domain-containing protein [Planctomycetota bacterium]